MSDNHIDTELLSAYLDGEVNAPERQAVEAHLATCPACAARKEALAGVIGAVAALPEAGPTLAEAAAIRRAVITAVPSALVPGAATVPARRREGRSAGWRQRLSWRLYVAAGAVALVVVGLGGYLALRPASHAGPTTAAVPAPLASPAPSASGTAASPREAAVVPGSVGPVLGSSDQARAYAATLPGVSPALGAVNAVLAPTATARFFAGLATPSGSGQSAEALGGLNVATPVPAAAPTVGADAATPGSLTSCVTQVLASLPAPAVPLAASEVLFQGQPAWLLVVATASPGAPAGQPLNLGNAFVMSRPGCATLDRSTFTR